MGPANPPSAAPHSDKKKPRPPLLLSIPIPISSRRRPPAPPPSSPLRYHHSTSIEDDLVFAMSPDQNTPPSLIMSRSPSSSHFEYMRRAHSHSSSALLQKYFNTTIPRPFLTPNPRPYSDEPFMYSVPNIRPVPSRPQTPKKKKKASTANTPHNRRHALLKPYTPPRSSATCSSSQTSEDELDVVGQRQKAHPLTSAFSRSISTTTSSATTSTASSSVNSSVDGLLLTAFSASYPDFTLFPNDVTVSPTDEKRQHQRASAGFFSRVKSGLPSPSPSRSPSSHSRVVSTSYGLEKYLREVGIAKGVHNRSSPIEEVSRGRPRDRRSSRGVDAPLVIKP